MRGVSVEVLRFQDLPVVFLSEPAPGQTACFFALIFNVESAILIAVFDLLYGHSSIG